MRVEFKISQSLRAGILADLARRHEFAFERVGFIYCRPGTIRNGVIILAADYAPVADADYVDDRAVGARIGSDAFRKVLQHAYHNDVSVFHVHCHDHAGAPQFSRTDTRETARFVPDFWNVRPALPHGALIFSRDSATGRCWLPKPKAVTALDRVVFAGRRLQVITNYVESKVNPPELSGSK